MYRASTSDIRGSNAGLGKINSTLHPFSGSINEYQISLGIEHWGFSRQTCEALTCGFPCSPLSTRPVAVGKDEESRTSFILISLY
ncbi:hypothetical protein TNCV_3163851 [Trichonephila clavipes]|nr:hypothetical protein TNCV_3163851 [Trichonephila clavipes]